MRSREISVSILIQNLAQLKALFEKQWESIVGNCDTFLYLGGNEQSTHEYLAKLLGKETIDTDSFGRTKGRSGSFSFNHSTAGRELMDPSEIRMMDNHLALLFLRGERPVRDTKFDLLKHRMIRLVRDGGAPAYTYGEDRLSLAGFTVEEGKEEDHGKAEPESYFLFSEEEFEELLDAREEKRNEEKNAV